MRLVCFKDHIFHPYVYIKRGETLNIYNLKYSNGYTLCTVECARYTIEDIRLNNLCYHSIPIFGEEKSFIEKVLSLSYDDLRIVVESSGPHDLDSKIFDEKYFNDFFMKGTCE